MHTRHAGVSRLLSDVLAVLPKARSLPAPGNTRKRIVAAAHRNQTRSQGSTRSVRLTYRLAAAHGPAAEVRSSHGRRLMIGSWFTYAQAAHYTGWSVGHLRNLVSAGQIPVYGRPRVRRFRRDMLDLYLTNPDMAMRTFLAERNEPYGR
jgi:excisionase family DNA binding protein